MIGNRAGLEIGKENEGENGGTFLSLPERPVNDL
jgi:hypothetical protein